MDNGYLLNIEKLFRFYKDMAENAVAQIDDIELHRVLATDSNSIAVILNHISGNMLSRFTNFLTEDGEKEWRKRDMEFTERSGSREEILTTWHNAWNCLFEELKNVKPKDLNDIVYIRNEGHTVHEALNRQLAHYAYHVGQIVMLCKIFKGDKWKSLSIPKGQSDEFNLEKFSKEKSKRHFTDNP